MVSESPSRSCQTPSLSMASTTPALPGHGLEGLAAPDAELLTDRLNATRESSAANASTRIRTECYGLASQVSQTSG